MGSRGAPPQAPDPRLLFEFLDDAVFNPETVGTGQLASYRHGSGQLFADGSNEVKGVITAINNQGHTAGGVPYKKLVASASHKELLNDKLLLPLCMDYSVSPLIPAKLRRYYRIIFEAAIWRDQVSEGGGVGIGAQMNSTSPFWDNTSCAGIMLRSLDTKYDGNWHVARRVTTGGGSTVEVSPDSGIAADDTPRHFRLDYVTGPARALTISLDGVVLQALSASELPAADLTQYRFMIGAVSKHSGTDTYTGIAQARYAVELLP